ncbi:hypothetical protein AC623_04435 [Bacillus sp. FJAT-27231]|uniref:HD domain-containing protein n=1 Tax=Bacillus sp. FJAT-27231 TaxID=1679168 RepID=UPI0006A22237|nr:HD domain-containing protein [Bacillus sp. FJAT-27231]KMY53331.1 hypothetical protein AC623_04435 [Bacillus sp. FJAT-27231]
MNLIEKAINFAATAHKGQVRKVADIPYIAHPFAVGMMLQKAGCADEVIAAGILHDTLEDTEATYDQLVTEFGRQTADIVQAASEHDKSLSWEERKRATIEALPFVTKEALQVIVCDKLHNIRSIYESVETEGAKAWEHFNQGKSNQHWYYSNILKQLKARRGEFKLIRDLESEVNRLFIGREKLTNETIDLLFDVPYQIIEEKIPLLEKAGLLEFVKEVHAEADFYYRNGRMDFAYRLMEAFQTRGIEFQSNSDGPILLMLYTAVLQKRLAWSDDEIYRYFKRNEKKL